MLNASPSRVRSDLTLISVPGSAVTLEIYRQCWNDTCWFLNGLRPRVHCQLIHNAAFLGDHRVDDLVDLLIGNVRESPGQNSDNQARCDPLFRSVAHGDDYQGSSGGFEINIHQALPNPSEPHPDHGLSAPDIDMDQVTGERSMSEAAYEPDSVR